jgi:hypothetical protein
MRFMRIGDCAPGLSTRYCHVWLLGSAPGWIRSPRNASLQCALDRQRPLESSLVSQRIVAITGWRPGCHARPVHVATKRNLNL